MTIYVFRLVKILIFLLCFTNTTEATLSFEEDTPRQPPEFKTVDIPLPVRKAQSAVFKIQTHDGMIRGTGFFIKNQNTFLTNFHVIFHLLLSDSKINVTDAQGNPQGKIIGIKALSSLNHDLALLEVDGYTGPVLKSLPPASNINQDYEMLDTLFLLSSEKVLKVFLMNPSFNIPNTIQASIQQNIALDGSSGGPALNSQGLVVGVLSSGYSMGKLIDIIDTNTLNGILKTSSETEDITPFTEWKNSKSHITNQMKQLSTKITQGDALTAYNFSRLIESEDNVLSLFSLHLSAKQGYAPAQHSFSTTVLNQLTDKAQVEPSNLLFLQQSAEQGYIPAQNNLGIILYNGMFGWDKNIEEATKWFLTAARQGSEQALLHLVQIILFDEGMSEEHQTTTTGLLRYFAQKGFVKSQYYLGHMYLKGKGSLEPDNQKALFWLYRAARGGLPKAQVLFGSLLHNGEAGFIRSPEAALPYFQKAARQGSKQAQTILEDYYDE